MLKCQSELFQPSLKLVDGLKMNTKEELKRMAKILLLPVPTKLHKDEYVTYFAEAVLTCPEMWLSRLTHYELALSDETLYQIHRHSGHPASASGMHEYRSGLPDYVMAQDRYILQSQQLLHL